MKQIVIASTYTQFLDWCHQTDTDRKTVWFASKPEYIMGIRRDIPVLMLTPWLDRSKDGLARQSRMERIIQAKGNPTTWASA